MLEVLKFIIGILVLAIGFPLGNYLAKATKEELHAGQRWFKLIILASFIGAILSLILGNDALMFGFLFMAIITRRSLKKPEKKKKR